MPADKARRTLTGPTYAVTLPTYAAARDFARAATELTRKGLPRAEAVRRLADRCNIKVLTP